LEPLIYYHQSELLEMLGLFVPMNTTCTAAKLYESLASSYYDSTTAKTNPAVAADVSGRFAVVTMVSVSEDAIVKIATILRRLGTLSMR
jgi:hypothetical protein